MHVTIVPITEEHTEGFHRCLDTVAREKRYLSFVVAPPLSGTRDFVLSNIASGHVQLVALAEREVVGWCDILPRNISGYAHCGTLGMGVHPEHRGRGIGRRLLCDALDRVRTRGIERVELEVYASNEVARALYTNVGFETEGVKRRARKVDGAYDDIVLMALFLDRCRVDDHCRN